jgi:hypothetical protein
MNSEGRMICSIVRFKEINQSSLQFIMLYAMLYAFHTHKRSHPLWILDA